MQEGHRDRRADPRHLHLGFDQLDRVPVVGMPVSMSAPSARIVDALTGARAPTEFFKALDDATRQAAETALAREMLAAAVGDYSCSCGSTYEFTADSTLEEYAGLNRWLGRHEACTIHGSELDRLERDNTKLRESAEALLTRVDELEDELVGLRDAHQATLGLLAQAHKGMARMATS